MGRRIANFIFYSNTLKNNRTRLDFIRRRRAFAVYARERKPLLSRAQTFIITSVNLYSHDKKGRHQVFAAFCLKGRRKKQEWEGKKLRGEMPTSKCQHRPGSRRASPQKP